jgi:hypothetical protein
MVKLERITDRNYMSFRHKGARHEKVRFTLTLSSLPVHLCRVANAGWYTLREMDGMSQAFSTTEYRDDPNRQHSFRDKYYLRWELNRNLVFLHWLLHTEKHTEHRGNK